MPSAGCGKAPTLKNSPTTAINYNMVTSGGMSRRYILRYPSNYDNTHPYRLVIAYHWRSGSASQVFDCNTESIRCYTTQSPFYGLLESVEQHHDLRGARRARRRLGEQRWPGRHLYRRHPQAGARRSLHRQVADLRQRVQLRRGHVVRDRLCSSGCFPGRRGLRWWAAQRLQRRQLAGGVFGIHGLDDGTLGISGGRTMRDRFVRNNGCTAMSPPEPANNSGSHICTSYQGCSAGQPVRWCAFDGSNGHDPSPKDPGQSMTWNPRKPGRFSRSSDPDKAN